MINAKQVAEYFLTLDEPDFGDNISNLKLQKLLYYAQGFHLALYGEPLFSESIEAWEHGPVVPALYHEYKHYGATAIDVPEKINIDVFSQIQIELLNEVYEIYGQFSAWKLRNMTHSESPWVDTGYNEIIDPNLMKEFFKTLLA